MRTDTMGTGSGMGMGEGMTIMVEGISDLVHRTDIITIPDHPWKCVGPVCHDNSFFLFFSYSNKYRFISFNFSHR